MELGAEFIHGDVNPIVELCEKEGWSRRHLFTWSHGDGGPAEAPAPDGGMGYYYLGAERRLLRFDDPDPDFAACNEALWRLPETEAEDADADTRSLRQYLVDEGVPSRMLGMACAGYGNTAGGTSDSVPAASAMRLERAWRGDGTELDPDFRMQDSFGVLVEHLSQGLNIRLRSPVEAVVASPPSTLSPSFVTLHVRGGEAITARKAIVTVPLPVLKSGAIKFFPPLPPRKLAAINSMSFANGVKVVLKFRVRPWPAHCHGVVCADSFIPEMWMNNNGVGVGGLITGSLCSYAPGALGYQLHLEREQCPDDPSNAAAAVTPGATAAATSSGSAGSSSNNNHPSSSSSPSPHIMGCVPPPPHLLAKSSSTTIVSTNWETEDGGTLEESANASYAPPRTASPFLHPTNTQPSRSVEESLDDGLGAGDPAGASKKKGADAAEGGEEEAPVEIPGVYYVVTGFIMGSRADTLLEAHSQPTIIARFLAQMDTMFGGTATHPSLTPASDAYLEGFVHNWGKEAFIGGAYSTPTALDDPRAPSILREPCMGDRLFFAGEATAGSVDGALRHLPQNRVNYASPIVLHGAMNSGALAATDVAESLGKKERGPPHTHTGLHQFTPTYKFKDDGGSGADTDTQSSSGHNNSKTAGLLVWRQAAAAPPSPHLSPHHVIEEKQQQPIKVLDLLEVSTAGPSSLPASPRLAPKTLAARRGFLASRSLPRLILEGQLPLLQLAMHKTAAPFLLGVDRLSHASPSF